MGKAAKKDDFDLDAIIADKKKQETPASFFITAGVLNAVVPICEFLGWVCLLPLAFITFVRFRVLS